MFSSLVIPSLYSSPFQNQTKIVPDLKKFLTYHLLLLVKSIDLDELYNFVVGVEVWGWSFTYDFDRFRPKILEKMVQKWLSKNFDDENIQKW